MPGNKAVDIFCETLLETETKMQIRAKFKVTSIKQVDWAPHIRIVGLSAVSNDGTPENQRFHKYTPSATLEMTIDNPPAADAFVLGKQYYVDFTPAE